MAILAFSYKEALEDDGKITIDEAPELGMNTAIQSIKIAKVSKEALAEAKNLTVPEVVQLVLDIKATPQFEDLETPKIAGLIEGGFMILQGLEHIKGVFSGKSETVLQGNVAAALASVKNGL